MKKLILLLCLMPAFLFAYEFSGGVSDWKVEELLGFDAVHDNAVVGDISSVYLRNLDDYAIVRLSFRDMAERRDNAFVANNFTDKQMRVQVQCFSGTQLFYTRDYQISDKTHVRQSSVDNLLEIILPTTVWSEDNQIKIQVYSGEILADSFESYLVQGRGSNIAFVHHGNQGLTYTEVFYGQSPQESSGFDEVLEVHEATNIPGNFHMSGTLMPAAQWHNPEFNQWLVDGVTAGWIGMLTSALGQHIMPFVTDEMNNWSVAVQEDMVNYRYGYTPRVAWVPERVWLSPGVYPDAGVIDWLGDNWTQHGIEAVILDDSPHLWNVARNKIHWMNNNEGISLRTIPIDNNFVGAMHSSSSDAINYIALNSEPLNGISVYGTDWEVAAEMNEHHATDLLDDYERVIWYCHDNFPGVNVWKLDNAINNPSFNGVGVDVTNGNYGLLGGGDGYGGGNNGWYTHWAGAASLSDHHDPAWNYGYIWSETYNNIMTCPDNNLSQLAWYTLMINLHETGWHDSGDISGWEHRYSSHIKNANVYAEASRWTAADDIITEALVWDIDKDGVDELVIKNQRLMAVFESAGGRAQWIFIRDEFGTARAVVGSDVAYYPETDGDYNESSNNHVAAFSDVSPNYQHELYAFNILENTPQHVEVELSHGTLTKTLSVGEYNRYIAASYESAGDVYIKSGWTPDLLNIIWNGKRDIQRMWNTDAAYCGRRNADSGATVAYIMGEGGASFSSDFEGTLVMGDEIYGANNFKFFLFAGYSSEPYDTHGNRVEILDDLALLVTDDINPHVMASEARIVGDNKLEVVFSEKVSIDGATNANNYTITSTMGSYNVQFAFVRYEQSVILVLDANLPAVFTGTISINNVTDLANNPLPGVALPINTVVVPHLVGSFNNWDAANHDYEFQLRDSGYWTCMATLPSGIHEYKVIESDAWDNSDWPGTNQIITLDGDTGITWIVNCGMQTGVRTGDEFVSHSYDPIAVTGNFMSLIDRTDWDVNSNLYLFDNGTGGDLRPGDGMFTGEVDDIPQGTYEYKIILNANWDQATAGNQELLMEHHGNVTFKYHFPTNTISHITVWTSADNELATDYISPTNFDVYPNPFNPSTQVSFDLASAVRVRLDVYNVKGQHLLSLFDDYARAGTNSFSWQGIDKYGKQVGSGVYFFRLHSNQAELVKKAVLIK